MPSTAISDIPDEKKKGERLNESKKIEDLELTVGRCEVSD